MASCHGMMKPYRCRVRFLSAVHHPALSFFDVFLRRSYCVMRATLGSEPVAMVTEVLFENRTQYLMNSLLNQPIDYGRYSQRSYPSLCLGYFHRSDRRWLVFASSQLALQCFPMLSDMFLQFLYAHPVYSGRPSIGLYHSGWPR